MRLRGLRLCLLVQSVLVLAALWTTGAAAEPGSGPRETVDQTFTTTQPGAPTGVGFTGRYHAAGDENGNPPYMERMVFYPPEGLRYDTSVPEHCTASDLELSMRGPAACPEGSRLGGGTTEGIVFAPVANSVEMHRYTHTMDIMNNADEQIILVKAEGYAVARGKFQPDGSIEFASPTCFPEPPTGCAGDHVLQLASTSSLPPLTNESGSYATTPPTCPDAGHWTTRIAFWWKDGSFDEVATTQPCSQASGS